MVAGVISQTALAEDRPGFSRCGNAYLDNYEAAYKAGIDVGRNLVDDGALRQDGSATPISDDRACSEAEQFDLALNPPAPEPVAAPETETAVTPTSTGSTSWDAVAACESSGDWSISTGNGYYGGLQFDSPTWDAYGDPSCAEASDCSREAQIAAASAMPYDGWPNC